MSDSNDDQNTIQKAINHYRTFYHFGPYAIKGGETPPPDPSKEGKEGESENVEGLKSALEKEREARKTAEKTAKDLDKRLKDIETSGKSESEKLAARLEALEKDNLDKGAKLRARDAEDATRKAAKTAGAPDTDIVFRVIKSDIEYDSDGEPTNIKALIDDLKTTTPHLFKPAATRVDGGAGNGAKPNKGDEMNALIRRSAGREA